MNRRFRRLINSPQYWRFKSEETRSVAEWMAEGEVRSDIVQALHLIADSYEQIAEWLIVSSQEQ